MIATIEGLSRLVQSKAKTAGKLLQVNALPPVDDLRLQRTIPVEAGLDEDQVQDVIRTHVRQLDDMYKSMGASGLGCENAYFHSAEEGQATIELLLHPKKTGERVYLEVLVDLLEDEKKPEFNEENLPFEDHPEDRVSDENLAALMAKPGPKDLSDILARIEERQGK